LALKWSAQSDSAYGIFVCGPFENLGYTAKWLSALSNRGLLETDSEICGNRSLSWGKLFPGIFRCSWRPGNWDRLCKAHRLARHETMKAGTVWINSYNIFDAALPSGGYKQSGWGREMGREALELYTEVKSVCVKV
jgi:hypothetical protein